jgi:hypothetical protein
MSSASDWEPHSDKNKEIENIEIKKLECPP